MDGYKVTDEHDIRDTIFRFWFNIEQTEIKV